MRQVAFADVSAEAHRQTTPGRHGGSALDLRLASQTRSRGPMASSAQSVVGTVVDRDRQPGHGRFDTRGPGGHAEQVGRADGATERPAVPVVPAHERVEVAPRSRR